MPEIIPMEMGNISVNTQRTPAMRYAQAIAAATTQEAPVEAPKAPEITAETSPQDSVRIAALLRREKLLQKRSRELQERERLLKEQETSYSPWKEASELAKTNKLKAIEKLGIGYQDLTQQVLNDGNLPPDVLAAQKAEEIVSRRLAEIEVRQKEAQAEATRTQYANAMKHIDAEAKSMADASDKFPLVKELEAFHDITEHIEKTFHETGKILSVEEAAQIVEQGLFADLEKLFKIEKIRSKFVPQPITEEPKIESATIQPVQKISTLTHKTTVNPPALKPMSINDRRERAIRAFRGEPVS